jgi:hypothetical protein
LINVQVDNSSFQKPGFYNLAAANEEERSASLKYVKEWIDAVSFLGSKGYPR